MSVWLSPPPLMPSLLGGPAVGCHGGGGGGDAICPALPDLTGPGPDLARLALPPFPACHAWPPGAALR